MRDEDEREPVAVQFEQQVHHLAGGLRVEVARRLVRPHDLRIACQCAGDRHALLLTAGQFGRAVIQTRAEPDAFQRALRLRAGFLRVDAREEKRQFDVLGRREDGDQVEGLEDESHRRRAVLRALRVAHLVNVVAADEHGAGVDVVEAGQAVQHRRLARARRPHHGHEFTLTDGDGHVFERVDGFGASSIGLPDVGRDQNRRW